MNSTASTSCRARWATSSTTQERSRSAKCPRCAPQSDQGTRPFSTKLSSSRKNGRGGVAISSRALRIQTSCAAAGASDFASPPPEEDPYKVLEVSPFLGSDKMMGAYNRKMKAAEGNEEEEARIEAAYNKILMKQLTQCQSGETFGGVKMGDSLRYADELTWYQKLFMYIPWRPKVSWDSKKDIAINFAMMAFAWAWALLSVIPNLQPMTVAMFPYMYRLLQKLHALNPSPDNPDNPEKKKQDNAKFFRAVLMVLGFLSLGVVSVVSVPALLMKFVPLPAWVFTQQPVLVNLATTLCMFVGVSFYK